MLWFLQWKQHCTRRDIDVQGRNGKGLPREVSGRRHSPLPKQRLPGKVSPNNHMVVVWPRCHDHQVHPISESDFHLRGCIWWSPPRIMATAPSIYWSEQVLRACCGALCAICARSADVHQLDEVCWRVTRFGVWAHDRETSEDKVYRFTSGHP